MKEEALIMLLINEGIFNEYLNVMFINFTIALIQQHGITTKNDFFA
jgi:hypothetical protein